MWEPDPEKPGYLRFVRMRSVGEVFADLKERLETEGVLPEEYFHVSVALEFKPENRDKKPHEIPFPKGWRQIACYAVTGASEGHYIHVAAVMSDGRLETVFLGKTFRGMDFALKAAGSCARHLGA